MQSGVQVPSVHAVHGQVVQENMASVSCCVELTLAMLAHHHALQGNTTESSFSFAISLQGAFGALPSQYLDLM